MFKSISRNWRFFVPSKYGFFAFLSGFLRNVVWGCSLAAMAAGVASAMPLSPVQQADQKQKPSTSPSAPAAPAAATGAPTDGAGKRADVFQPQPAIDPKTGLPLYETIQEDWSSLAIGVSKLTPQTPVFGQTDQGDGFTRTLVQLQWRPGDPLDLYVILPKGVTKPPVVLYLYGYKEDTDRFKDNRWCERVTSGGVAAVGFVSALSGHRFHDRPMKQWFVSELQESVGSTVHDVHFILDYLAQRGDVDMNRVGMFGQSSGGTVALLAAAADPRIKVVDALDPWGDWPVWLAKSPVLQDDASHTNFTSAEFLKKVAPLDPVKWLPTLTSTQVRIQQVKDNETTPHACQEALTKAAPKQAEVVEFDHVRQLAAAEGGGGLFDWVKAGLKRLPTPGPKESLVTQVHPQDSNNKDSSNKDSGNQVSNNQASGSKQPAQDH